MAPTINPSTSIFSFVFITLIYFITKYLVPSNFGKILGVIYVVAIISTQTSINTGLAKSLCDNNKSLSVALLATIFPIVFMFGLLQLMLMIFPGWLEPFSNTIGYIIVKITGLNNLLNKLIVSRSADKSITRAINNIYNDPSIFINQFNDSDAGAFDTLWQKNLDAGIFTSCAKIGSPLYNQFKSLVKLKDIVSEFIWYILVGILVTSKSYNYIVMQPCSLSAETAAKKMDTHLDNKKDLVSQQNYVPPGYSYSQQS